MATMSREQREDCARTAPAKPTWDKHVELSVVGRRCVYLNNYRIAGDKPYYTENLPHHEFKVGIGDVLEAFRPEEIRAALDEQAAYKKHWADYHARLDAEAKNNPEVE